MIWYPVITPHCQYASQSICLTSNQYASTLTNMPQRVYYMEQSHSQYASEICISPLIWYMSVGLILCMCLYMNMKRYKFQDLQYYLLCLLQHISFYNLKQMEYIMIFMNYSYCYLQTMKIRISNEIIFSLGITNMIF